MRNDPKVDMKNHWKLVTIMIGAIDFCVENCFHNDPETLISNAAKDFALTLRILRENLPRTMVNVILPPDASIVTRFTNKPAECQSFHYVMCPCFFPLEKRLRIQTSIKTIKRLNLI